MTPPGSRGGARVSFGGMRVFAGPFLGEPPLKGNPVYNALGDVADSSIKYAAMSRPLPDGICLMADSRPGRYVENGLETING